LNNPGYHNEKISGEGLEELAGARDLSMSSESFSEEACLPSLLIYLKKFLDPVCTCSSKPGDPAQLLPSLLIYFKNFLTWSAV